MVGGLSQKIRLLVGVFLTHSDVARSVLLLLLCSVVRTAPTELVVV